MYRVALQPGADLEGFRLALRRLAAAEVRPDEIAWVSDAQDQLLGEALPDAAAPLAMPAVVGEMIGDIVCHRDPERYALLYQLVWRVRHGERRLLEAAHDPLVHRLDAHAQIDRPRHSQDACLCALSPDRHCQRRP